MVFSTKLIVFKDSVFNFSIDKNQIFLETIVITDKKSNTTNKVILDDLELKKIPPLLGEYDYLKALAFQPGVNTGSEAGAGLHVRGGTPDQNLILLDDPVFSDVFKCLDFHYICRLQKTISYV